MDLELDIKGAESRATAKQKPPRLSSGRIKKRNEKKFSSAGLEGRD
jgi:hypothetical protein